MTEHLWSGTEKVRRCDDCGRVELQTDDGSWRSAVGYRGWVGSLCSEPDAQDPARLFRREGT